MMPPPAMIQANPAGHQVGLVTPAAAEIVAKDAMISWYKGEFAAANAIIDALTSHLEEVNGVGQTEYMTAFAAINRRRQNWFPVLHMQKYFSIAEVMRELQKVADGNKASAAAVVEDGDQNSVTAAVVKDDDQSSATTAAVISSGDVSVVTERKDEEEVKAEEEKQEKSDDVKESGGEAVVEDEKSSKCLPDGEGFHGGPVDEDSLDSDITDTGSHEEQRTIEHNICENHEDCRCRREQIKMTKGFVAKEPVKGHTVNVVKGLKLYENIFSEGEISRLNEFVYELRAAGQNRELSGGTYILFNKQIKGNKREQIHVGVPLFGSVKDSDQKSNLDPIPMLLRSVINHLVLWQIIPETRQPNGCIINYFDEEEHSQPYLKPPHVDQPICTLLLSETIFAFGRTLVNDGEGNFKANLMLSVKEGSVLLMRNNSADMARHAVCAAPTKRVSLNFFRVRPEANHFIQASSNRKGTMMLVASPTQATTFWQPNPCFTTPPAVCFEPMTAMNMTGVICESPPPMVMLAHPMSIRPPAAVIMNQQQGKMMMPNGGTGVFLPWANRGSRKQSNRHLPPRAQRTKLLALQPPSLPPTGNVELHHHHMMETNSDPESSDVKEEI